MPDADAKIKGQIGENEQLQESCTLAPSLGSSSGSNGSSAPKLPIELILDKAQEVIAVFQDGKHKYANQGAEELHGYSIEELYDKPVKDLVYPDDYPDVLENSRKRLQGDVIKYPHRIIAKNGEIKWVESFGVSILWEGRPANLCFITDITAQVKAEHDLREKSIALEQTNTALEVLLKHREKDLNEVEEKIVNNVKELILPYVEKMKARPLPFDTASYVEIIERHAREIISPFLMKMQARCSHMTPREIQIAALVKDGKTTKDISDILGLSHETVHVYRKRIRKKLQLKHKNENLRSHLLSLE